MELRSLAPGDGPPVRRIAGRSMESAFESMIPAPVIHKAIEEWYGTEEFDSYLSDDDMDFVVAEKDGEVVGFTQSHVVEALGKGRILWVHVDPDHRSEGIGSELVGATIDRLHERGIDSVTALVLAEHEEGRAFYEANGFSLLSNRTVRIAGEEFREHVMLENRSPEQPPKLHVDTNGEEFYVDVAESDRGSHAPFAPVYRDPDRNHRYGWFCTACESVETAMDPMGRIRCASCDNTRRPTRWDAAYL